MSVLVFPGWIKCVCLGDPLYVCVSLCVIMTERRERKVEKGRVIISAIRRKKK